MLTKGKIDKELIHKLSTEIMFRRFQVFTRKRQILFLSRRRNSNVTWWTEKAIHLQFPDSFSRDLCR